MRNFMISSAQHDEIKRMRQSGHVAHMGDGTGAYTFWWGSLREGDHLEDLSVDGRTILICVFKKLDGEA